MSAAQDTPRDAQGGLSNAYWHQFVLDDGTVLRVVFSVEQLYRLRDRWLKDGTRERTFGDIVNVFMSPGEESANAS